MELAVIDSDVDAPPGVLASVPAAAGSRLHFAWGAGTQVRLCEVRDSSTGAGGSEPCTSTVTW
jgi:nuclear pore complex protein Nup85